MTTPIELIRIVVADDHVAIRNGLQYIFSFQKDFSLVAAVEDGKELLAAVKGHQPHIIITDLKMREVNGPEACAAVLKEFPDASIIVYSMYDHEDVVRKMRGLGIRGYVLKDGKGDEICTAVRTVHGGGEYYCPSIRNRSNRLFQTGTLGRSTIEKQQEFTETELQIIRLFCQDYSVKQIAARLKIKIRMVLTHKEHIENKMNVHGVIPIVVYAMQNWLLY